MRRLSILSLVAAFVLGAIVARAESAKMSYPQAKKVDQVDDYHGTKVADPYRWLEQDVRESAEVKSWIEAENAITQPYLAAIPERETIEKRLTELWNYEKFGTPYKAGGRYYYSRNDGLQNQSVVWVQTSMVDPPQVLLDPNTWSADGTVALAGMSFSDDGRYVAYAVAEAGSDWQTWHVMEIADRKVLADEIKWTKFTNAAWTLDGNGFFYSRFPEPQAGATFQTLNLNQQLYYHRIGTPQSADVLAFERPDQPEWGFSPEVTEDGRYLVLSVWKTSAPKNLLFVRDLSEPFGTFVPVIKEFENEYSLIGNDQRTLYVKTDRDASRGRVVAIDLAAPAPEHWRAVIPQGSSTLVGASYVGNVLIAQYLKDAYSQVAVFTPAGKRVREVTLPGIGSAGGFGGKKVDTETFYGFSSFATPPTIFRYDIGTGESAQIRQAAVKFDPNAYEVEQVFYPSKDGTKVPMFIAHRKGIVLDGSNPTLLYGYGGFNVSLTPTFSISKLAWMEMGGIYALANLRGGGEYGEEWHQAGTKLNKQNVFDDFIGAAEYLVAQRYTRPDRLAIQGGSNGGLLIGAVVNQRPDLFGAALPAVGVMDMLRYQKFTAGRYWVDDFGASDNADEFKALWAYSPYHNLKPGTKYPATMITTADTDDRVVPGHSFKYAAAMQAAQAGDAPILIRIETRAGHGAGTPTSKQIEEVADEWAFVVKNLQMTLPTREAPKAEPRPQG
jgi:prolyl oligopeptidase